MQHFNTLLYAKTSQTMTHQLDIQFSNFRINTSISMYQFLNDLLKTNHKDLTTQQHLSSELLNIGQFIPIFVTPQIVLCPLYAKRAPHQMYINMAQVIGMVSSKNQTRIFFPNNQHVVVDIPITFCSKKWKECILLTQLLMGDSV
ncbi:hypothetical protein [Staphylococcus ratti]|uniref:ComK family protein n=1 Tax=Staphylococcus ratti TaxID=2892440 RepID=A0ABY3PF07_9STAP|nr:hypothetical protein [Staphylococcus ratti]UEX90907.1 hypothetical protein LN051_04640 [Staphylococcus ratti]